MKVPFIDLTRQHAVLATELTRAAASVIERAQFILGPEVAALESELSASCGVQHGIGVGSGTDALRLALEAVGVRPGDEVIVPAFTFVATAETVSQTGARPVFADVDDALNLDPEDAARRVTSRTRAMVPVHLYGQPANVGPLLALAERHGLAIIEDAAQAVGARWGDRSVGGLGRVACFSFFPTKNLGGCGDGGLLTTDDADVAARVRRLRNHGSDAKYVHREIGYCSRLDELQAAMLRVKLRHLQDWTGRRRALAARYRDALAGLPLVLPTDVPGTTAVYHLFTVRTPQRDALKDFLELRGIGSAVHYPVPLHQQPVYRVTDGPVLPVSERAAREVLSLPLYPELRADEQDIVIAAVREFFEGARASS
jgi:dTDP-4-amino-4,6-dideoxygalactose transaminase